nr:hypothetical protein [Achromobacter ruhlandii]
VRPSPSSNRVMRESPAISPHTATGLGGGGGAGGGGGGGRPPPPPPPPRDRRRHIVLAAAVPCRPCAYEICPIGHPCALGVGVADVLDRARRQLAETA